MTLTEEKKVVLHDITKVAETVVFNDRVMTHAMLKLIIKKCKELIVSDF